MALRSQFGPSVTMMATLFWMRSRTWIETGYRRFFSSKKDLTAAELEQLTDVDFSQVVALVVTAQGKDGEILIGGGRYARDGMGSVSAELAFTTDSNYRGGGIATSILRHLVQSLERLGYRGLRRMFSRKISLCLLSFGIAACQCNFTGTVASYVRFHFNRFRTADLTDVVPVPARQAASVIAEYAQCPFMALSGLQPIASRGLVPLEKRTCPISVWKVRL